MRKRGRGVFEAEVAEADGNRTRRGCVATPSYGFEVRGPHQRDNRFRGRVYRKASAFPPTFEGGAAAVGLGPVENDGGVTPGFVKSGSYETEVSGTRYPARASLRPMFDPKGERIRS